MTPLQKTCLHPGEHWKDSIDLFNHKFEVTCGVCELKFEYNQKTDKITLYENPDDSP